MLLPISALEEALSGHSNGRNGSMGKLGYSYRTYSNLLSCCNERQPPCWLSACCARAKKMPVLLQLVFVSLFDFVSF